MLLFSAHHPHHLINTDQFKVLLNQFKGQDGPLKTHQATYKGWTVSQDGHQKQLKQEIIPCHSHLFFYPKTRNPPMPNLFLIFLSSLLFCLYTGKGLMIVLCEVMSTRKLTLKTEEILKKEIRHDTCTCC